MASEEIKIQVQSSPREELIRTAVSFLTNPNVQKSPESQKEAFLKKKGLTNEEIKLAFERSNLVTLPLVHQVHLVESIKPPLMEMSWFQRIKNILNTLMLIVGGSYGLYYLYKKFIEPFLFGKPKKPKTIENSISNLNKTVEKSIGDLKSDVQKVYSELERVIVMHNEQQNSAKQISELKSEIATVKGILLSRHQFSSVNLSRNSIPSWQLPGSSHKDDKEEGDDGEHNSGSSETEIVPNANSNNGSQGSDSSLEMIKDHEG